jgi:uncharacterized delta-60 repeat protein
MRTSLAIRLTAAVLASGLIALTPRPATAAAGDVDATFGKDGRVTTRFLKGDALGRDVAIQTDGKILAGGFVSRPSGRDVFALTRYLPDGSLDRSFDDGSVTTSFGRRSARLEGLTIQPDGRIVAVGRVETPAEARRFIVVRYLSDGTIDHTFGIDGKVNTRFFGRNGDALATDVAVQPDGKIIVVGSARLVGSVDGDFAVARYLPDGTLDRTFSENGKVHTPFHACSGIGAGASAVAFQTDGRIVVVGAHIPCLALARYLPDGTLDTTFGGGDGRVETSSGGSADLGAHAVAISVDGKIVVAGEHSNAFLPGGPRGTFFLARYRTHGRLDPMFGRGDGRVTTAFAPRLAAAVAVAIQADDKIVAVGGAGDFEAHRGEFALARYMPDGTLDASFSADGKLTTRFPVGQQSFARGAAMQTDGRVVAAGEVCGDLTSCRFALARYSPS